MVDLVVIDCVNTVKVEVTMITYNKFHVGVSLPLFGFILAVLTLNQITCFIQ